MLKRFCRSGFAGNDSGATAIEYGLIAGLIAVAVITAIMATGNATGTMFNYVSEHAAAALTTNTL